MNIVYKYELAVTDRQEIDLPHWARVLHVAEQRGRLFVWALVNPDVAMEPRVFHIVGTGNRIDAPASELEYIGTVHMMPYVWHVFVEKERD